LYLTGGDGRLWVSSDAGRSFRAVDQPAEPFGRPVDLACLGGRAALIRQVATHRFVYYACDARRCTAPVTLSWSRVHRAQLATTGDAVVVLLAGARTLLSRRDPGAAGKPGRPAAVSRWRRPPRDWAVAKGPNAQRQALLLLDRALLRLRTGDGAKTWQGE
jgi:hypothetical protein